MNNSAPSSAWKSAAASAYCRAARRIRAEHAQSPAMKHRALAAMSEAADRAAGVADHCEPAASFGTRAFAREAAPLCGDVLCCSDRQRLVDRAQTHGLSPFEANLVIAMLQHRGAAAADFWQSGPAGPIRPTITEKKPPGSPWRLFAAMAALQGLLLLGAWIVAG